MSPLRHHAITWTNADFFQLDSHEHVSRIFIWTSRLQNGGHFVWAQHYGMNKIANILTLFLKAFSKEIIDCVGTLPISTNLPRRSGFTRYDGWFVTGVLTPNKRQALSNHWVDPTSIIMNDMMQHTHDRIIESEKTGTCCMLMTCWPMVT